LKRYGFRLDRKAVDAYLRMKEKNLFFRGMIAWMGFKKAQVRFSVAERAGGRSKWSLHPGQSASRMDGASATTFLQC